MKTLAFDLDYTLYDQRQYLLGAFQFVAARMGELSGLSAKTLANHLIHLWEERGTDEPYLFNLWLRQLSLPEHHVPSCIHWFHSYQPHQLSLYDGVFEVLTVLKARFPLYLITDGHPQMQSHKIKVLKIASFFEEIHFVKNHGFSKDDPGWFEYWAIKNQINPSQWVYIGDHPTKDIMPARKARAKALRVLTGEFRNLPDDPAFPPTFTLPSLRELPKYLCI